MKKKEKLKNRDGTRLKSEQAKGKCRPWKRSFGSDSDEFEKEDRDKYLRQ